MAARSRKLASRYAMTLRHKSVASALMLRLAENAGVQHQHVQTAVG
jgi:hypothetical protein